ncbi:hypothetical protein BDV59DRAFT_200912 [Aspergillus ambiguus]|uniref:uncharacterized protein n=1 Tax=Aspergillus ambiguus TaxID=176160 RepID=UPI003CCD6017
MEFVGKILEKAIEEKVDHSSSGYSDGYNEPNASYGYGGAPPHPRISRIPGQRAEESWEHPRYEAPAYGAPAYGYESEPRPAEHKDHSALYAAGGAVAGVAVGAAGTAIVMNEGEEIREDWNREEARMEQNVEDFPEDAAQWTGEKVGEVEQIPENIEQDWDRAEDRVENGWDNFENDIENAPENAAEWVGEEVGEAEQFGDRMENAYEQGEAEGESEW